jgi:hypothetical protein
VGGTSCPVQAHLSNLEPSPPPSRRGKQGAASRRSPPPLEMSPLLFKEWLCGGAPHAQCKHISRTSNLPPPPSRRGKQGAASRRSPPPLEMSPLLFKEGICGRHLMPSASTSLEPRTFPLLLRGGGSRGPHRGGHHDPSNRIPFLHLKEGQLEVGFMTFATTPSTSLILFSKDLLPLHLPDGLHTLVFTSTHNFRGSPT